VRELQLEAHPDFGAGSGGTVSNPPLAVARTTSFAFQGQPRPLVGEPVLQLTGNTVIDVRSKTTVSPIGTPSSPQYGESAGAAWPRTTLGVRLQPVEALTGTVAPQFFDVLFAPSGQVLYASEGSVLALWVRDPDKVGHPRLDNPAAFTATPGLDTGTPFNAAGEQVLVTVYTRTGLIATHPVSNGADPFAAAKDGLNSGL
jgi:hypothetical protein